MSHHRAGARARATACLPALYRLLVSETTEYQYPSRFVDEQLHGPFRRWWHEHTFTATANGTTVMTDVVQFRSPLGPLGSLGDRLVLGRYMSHQRSNWLKTTLETRT